MSTAITATIPICSTDAQNEENEPIETAIELAYDLHVPKDCDPKLCPIIVFHGMFMNRSLYTELAVKLAEATKRKVYNVDQRCHGESPYLEETNCYLMAEDILLFFKNRNIKKATLVCHSFSSRPAVVFAIDEPHMVEKIVVADFYPYNDVDWKYYEFVTVVTAKINEVTSRVDLTRSEDEIRAECLEILTENNQTPMTNSTLKRLVGQCILNEKGFHFKYNKDDLVKLYVDGCFRLPAYAVYEGPVLFVVSGSSPFYKGFPDVKEGVKKYFPKATTVEIPNAYHEYLLEEPDEFTEITAKYLNTFS